jgi:riboflavin biosynthesis pyrimidine reductase
MAWRRAQGLPEVPVMAIATRTAALDPKAGIFTEAPRRPILICPADLQEERVAPFREVAEVVAVGSGDVDFAAAVAALRERGLRQVLCEGGPHVFGELIAAGLADELDLTLSPLLAGGGPMRIAEGAAAQEATPLRLRHVLEAGGNLILRYVRGSNDE